MEVFYGLKLSQSPDETSAKQLHNLVDRLQKVFIEFQEKDAKESETLILQVNADFHKKVTEEKVHGHESPQKVSGKIEVDAVLGDACSKTTPSPVADKFKLKMEEAIRPYIVK